MMQQAGNVVGPMLSSLYVLIGWQCALMVCAHSRRSCSTTWNHRKLMALSSLHSLLLRVLLPAEAVPHPA